jgi:hypothetical protein
MGIFPAGYLSHPLLKGSGISFLLPGKDVDRDFLRLYFLEKANTIRTWRNENHEERR